LHNLKKTRAMANHKSAEKRIRANDSKRVRNRYQAKTTRNLLKELRSSKDKAEVSKLVPEVSAMLDRLAKKNVIHKNKAANLKSSIQMHLNSL
jgi:small subunit ribosomal protein S20